MKTAFMAHLRYQEKHVLNDERQITEVLHSHGTPYQPRDCKPTCHSKSRGEMIPVPFTHLNNPPLPPPNCDRDTAWFRTTYGADTATPSAVNRQEHGP